MQTITIKIPDYTYSFDLSLWGDSIGNMYGEITSNIKIQEKIDDDQNILPLDEFDQNFNTAINAIESLVLAHAIAGVDIQSQSYINGLRTSIEAIENNC